MSLCKWLTATQSFQFVGHWFYPAHWKRVVCGPVKSAILSRFLKAKNSQTILTAQFSKKTFQSGKTPSYQRNFLPLPPASVAKLEKVLFRRRLRTQLEIEPGWLSFICLQDVEVKSTFRMSLAGSVISWNDLSSYAHPSEKYSKVRLPP